MQQDPTLPPPKKDAKYYLDKYGQYIGDGRYTDEGLAKMIFTNSSTKKPYKDLVLEASKKTGISPEILFSSLNEEGVRQMIHQNQYSGDKNYPISGYTHFGLDTFGDVYPQLVKKGYLPDNMDFSLQEGTNEKGQKIKTANFKNVEDAINSSAAMMKDVSDQIDAYAQKRGYNLSDKSKNFFMLAGFNGGVGLAQKMMDSYAQKGVLQNDAYLTKKPLSYAGVYQHVMRRMIPAEAWADDKVFAQPQQVAQQQPQQPIGQPYYQDGKIIAYNVNGKIIGVNEMNKTN